MKLNRGFKLPKLNYFDWSGNEDFGGQQETNMIACNMLAGQSLKEMQPINREYTHSTARSSPQETL